MKKLKVFFAKMDKIFWDTPHGFDAVTKLTQDEKEIRNEALNFVAEKNGRLRAFVRPAGPTKPGEIRIQGIDESAKGKDRIEKVLVVFFAADTREKSKKRRLKAIGWINDATVFRKHEKDEFPARSINGEHRSCNIEGSSENALLIPPESRIPFPWKGRWLTYPQKPDQEKALRLVREYSGPDLLKTSSGSAIEAEQIPTQAGYVADAKRRFAIEQHAVQAATKYCEKRGFKVTPKGKPYDLHCEHAINGEILLVEVKGTTTIGEKIILTAKEVDQEFLSKYPNSKAELFILQNICFPVGSNKPSGGMAKYIPNWKPREHKLTETQFSCALNTSKLDSAD